MNSDKRYYDLNTYFRERFGCRVQKISVDAGLTCPNRDGTVGRGGCLYCNPQGSGTGAAKRGQSVAQQIQAGKAFLSKRYHAKKFIAYFQSFSNTYAPVETLARLYDEALEDPDVVGLSIGTRPDCVADPVLSLLEAYAKKRLVWIEYGLQSMHDDTLDLIRRGHDFHCFEDAVARTRKRGIQICAHLILGLPGEKREQVHQTARAVAALGIDGVKLHLLYIIKGTPLERWYRQGAYTCLGQQRYASLVCDVLERLSPDTVIQRLTGDPHRAELVAPMWSLNKAETLHLIQKTLARRNTRQGERFHPLRLPH